MKQEKLRANRPRSNPNKRYLCSTTEAQLRCRCSYCRIRSVSNRHITHERWDQVRPIRRDLRRARKEPSNFRTGSLSCTTKSWIHMYVHIYVSPQEKSSKELALTHNNRTLVTSLITFRAGIFVHEPHVQRTSTFVSPRSSVMNEMAKMMKLLLPNAQLRPSC